MWLRIGFLIVKELLAVWRDPKSRFLLLRPPSSSCSSSPTPPRRR